MNAIVEQPRHSCALGAQQTVVAIERAIPIVHAGPGCAAIVHGGLCEGNGYQGSGYAGGAMIVSTNSGEREVIFGGEQTLRSVIEGTLQVMDGELLVVLTGCTAELVGDDTESVVASFRRRGVPIVHAATGGFRGSNLLGHERVVDAIVDQLLEPAPAVVPRLVNVFAGVPYQDPFWRGNLLVIQELLESIGLEVNILFGAHSGGLPAWQRIPAAGLNLVLSSWTNLSTAKLLEQRFGTPWLHQPAAPIGAEATSTLLRRVGAAAGLDPEKVEAAIARHEQVYNYQFERAGEYLLEARCELPTRFTTVSDGFYARGLSQLLTQEFGLIPVQHLITDESPPEQQRGITEALQQIHPPQPPAVTFSSDSGEIRQALEQVYDDHGPVIVFGSVWERAVVRARGGLHLTVTAPAADRLIIGASYWGYHGGWRLLEDLVTGRLNLAM